jgi:catechol 2,3-dioxygenase-like lactoylglutathione lyase family enzyme
VLSDTPLVVLGATENLETSRYFYGEVLGLPLVETSIFAV